MARNLKITHRRVRGERREPREKANLKEHKFIFD
jgi:hypothetical protein